MLVRRIVPAVEDRRGTRPLRCLRRPIPGFLALSCQIDPPVGVGRGIVPESVTSYSSEPAFRNVPRTYGFRSQRVPDSFGSPHSLSFRESGSGNPSKVLPSQPKTSISER